MKNLAFEFRRQTMHILLGLLIIFLALFDSNFTVWLLFFALIFGFFLSFLQAKFNFKIFALILDRFEREKYKRRFPFRGTLFFLVGGLLALKLFSFNIALASIAILTFADSVSHLVGKFGNKKNPLDQRKNIEGTLIGIVTGTIAASFFVPLVWAFLASLAAMIAETLSFKLQEEDVDDNVIIPLVAGTVIFLLQKFL